MKLFAATIIFFISLWSIFRSVPVNAAAALGEEIQPMITTSELVIGRNRFAFGLKTSWSRMQKLLCGPMTLSGRKVDQLRN
jgi:hypothetical protein